jgi:hypothetical protein
MRFHIYCIAFIFAFFLPVTVMAQGGLEGQPGQSAQDSPFSQQKFVPDISLIVDSSAVYRTLADEVHGAMSVPGFIERHGAGEEHGHAAVNGNIGFNFNYAELALFSAVDPYFELFAVFHLSAEGFEVEEAFVSSTALPLGLRLKAGKFLSGFGRLNQKHRHQWNFSDAPLVNGAFFGDEGLNEIGVQLAWTVPADFYLVIGGEALRGDNEASFGTGAFHDPAYLYRVSGSRGPNLFTGFIRGSLDIGGLSVLGGGSFAWGRTRSSHTVDEVDLTTATAEDLEGLGHGVRARTWIAGADITLRYDLDSYRYLSLQGEFMYRRMLGALYEYTAADATERSTLTREQSGLYTELLVKPFLRWRFGGRFDLLNRNRELVGRVNQNLPWNRYRIAAMTDFQPTEFTLFRLQYNYDRSGSDRFDRKRTNHQVVLQLNAAIGAHGAHPF